MDKVGRPAYLFQHLQATQSPTARSTTLCPVAVLNEPARVVYLIIVISVYKSLHHDQRALSKAKTLTKPTRSCSVA